MKRFKLGNGEFITYNQNIGDKNKLGVVFIHGFSANREGTKALAMEEFFRERNVSFLRFDLFGHGESSGKFEDGTINIWLGNVLCMIDNLTEGKQILVGASMGGWLMLLATLKRRERIAGLVGVAPAPDFTNCLPRIAEEKLDIPATQQLKKKGYFQIPKEEEGEFLTFTKKLIKNGNKNLLLTKRKIKISCPVRIIHGMADKTISYKRSFKLTRKLISNDVRITVIKDGEHRLSREEDIEIILKNIEELI